MCGWAVLAALAAGAPAPAATSEADAAWKQIEQVRQSLGKLSGEKPAAKFSRRLGPQAEERSPRIGGLALLQQHLAYFLRRFPDDAHALLARAWWVEVTPEVAEGLAVALDRARWDEERARLELATDVPPKVRAQVDAAILNARLRELALPGAAPEKTAQFVARLEEFVTRHKGEASRANYAFILGTMLRLSDEARADRAFAIAAASADPALAGRGARARAALPYFHRPLDLSFTALDGRRVDLAALRGKVVVVDFWATWCGPCVEDLPELLALYREFHPRGVEVVGVSLDTERKKLGDFVKARGMDWPQFFDGGGWDNKLARRFQIGSIPALWVVGKDGRLIDVEARGKLRALLPPLLAQK
ncbi:MAG: TlpA family protein disulfide reductase [Opitutae bacterium]|nr:TlpA family protein disulfide reductase [Opitutae bacterium]